MNYIYTGAEQQTHPWVALSEQSLHQILVVVGKVLGHISLLCNLCFKKCGIISSRNVI